jgi:hypothetical protein
MLSIKEPTSHYSHEEDIVVINETAFNSQAVLPADTTSTTTTTNSELKEGEATHRQLGGAAVAGGILGLVIAGPVIGVVVGIGAAVASTTKGKTGQVARAGGETMAAAGDRLKKWDQKHHIIEKTSNAVIKGCNSISKKLQPKNNSTCFSRKARSMLPFRVRQMHTSSSSQKIDYIFVTKACQDTVCQ